MGSILSFPILCLANLGVYLAVTRESQKGWTDRERLRHVLVNGDDMVYAADRSLWDSHVSLAAKVGLEMSVGKAYQHREYANINSTSVHLALHKPDVTPWQINYLNAGLYFGQHKVQERVDSREREDAACSLPSSNLCSDDALTRMYARAHLGQDPSLGLVTNLNVLLDGSLPGRQTQLLKKFISDHAEDIRKECTGVMRSQGRPHLFTRNLFIHQSLGGMGVLAPVGWKKFVSDSQLKVARACIENSTAPLTLSRPLPGYELNPLDSTVSVPWIKKESEPVVFSRQTAGSSRFGPLKGMIWCGVLRYGPHPGCVSN